MKTPLFPERGAPLQGPYSPGIKATGTMIFVSAQLPLDPATGQVVGETVQEQAAQVFENMRGVLAAGGATLADVVRTTVFLKNPEDFAALNEVYERTFPPPYPARTPVMGVAGRVLVYADAIAVVT